ncbi:hypothetical protein DFJ77DRAFT_425229 [Powellomyces hirtus]|nr:hypothetical protein DFJ77DRAFT_425229 [Powellomyces hirtus]
MSSGGKALCRFYALGTCQKRDCTFAHDRQSTDKPVCHYYQKGQCRFGQYCALKHEKIQSTPKATTGARTSTGKLAAEPATTQPRQKVLLVGKRTIIPSSAGLARATQFINSPPAPKTEPEEETIHLTDSELHGFAVKSSSTMTSPCEDASSASKSNNSTPLCPFAMQGICRYGEHCRYRHGLSCPVCNKQCLDPDVSPTVHAEHIQQCQGKLERDQRYNAQLAESADVDCVVCMEPVKSKSDARFGLLDCEHCVCLNCIRQWRTNERMDTSKSCPICRTVTHFVTPSAIWPSNPDDKAAIIEAYKTKLSTIDCKHYNRGEGSCPFGTSCFYKHVGRDGVAEEVRLRKVLGDEDSMTIVSSVKLVDFLEAYDSSRA